MPLGRPTPSQAPGLTTLGDLLLLRAPCVDFLLRGPPAELLLCNPWQGAKFILRAKAGGRVRVYDDQIRAESVYKSIIISRETTVADTLQLLAGCYGTKQLLDRPDR